MSFIWLTVHWIDTFIPSNEVEKNARGRLLSSSLRLQFGKHWHVWCNIVPLCCPSCEFPPFAEQACRHFYLIIVSTQSHRCSFRWLMSLTQINCNHLLHKYQCLDASRPPGKKTEIVFNAVTLGRGYCAMCTYPGCALDNTCTVKKE